MVVKRKQVNYHLEYSSKAKTLQKKRRFSFLMWTLWAVFVGGSISGLLIGGIEYTERVLAKSNNFIGFSLFSKDTNTIILEQKIASAIGSSSNKRFKIEPQKRTYKTVMDTVKSTAFIVGDLETGEIFLERNKSAVHPMASISKLITAVVVSEEIDPNTSILITSDAISTQGNSARLKRGERILASDLLYPLLMLSSNDASEAFADYFGRNDFVKKMNEKVMAIGAWSTRFNDPSGLSKKNVSTAEDIFNITKWVYQYKPEILDITALRMKKVKDHTWTNQTHFLNISAFSAGKVGFTNEAKETATTVFVLNDALGKKRSIGAVVMKSPNRDKDILELLAYLKDNYGFTE